ncbi:MAG: bifunctional glutamate N-acetyltransferase/amino-acid acetyltransferase ArgJ [Candidatus Omnitrophota bacterium]
MRIIQKAILPLGFKANGVSAGLKKSGKLDLALFYSEIPAKAACKFTMNKLQAAPLKVCKDYLRKSRVFQAIIVNSGNANCFTGKPGVLDAIQTTKYAADYLGIKKETVLVNSTGIIGKRLSVDKIKSAIPGLVQGLSIAGIEKGVKAIMTTDTFAKEITAKINIAGKVVTICGTAKGAGMIAPNMATMLAFIFTDANITQKALDKATRLAVNESFNCITVDGCMSTNDTLAVLANGACGNNLIDSGKNFDLFLDALKKACLELAKMIIKDAEGATKFIEIKVEKAKSFAQARIAALAIANSNLFKTALYGENPNFGRIAAAVGASGIDVKEEDIKIKVSSLKKKQVFVKVGINRGKSSAIVYTSDLTPEYIKINAEYN